MKRTTAPEQTEDTAHNHDEANDVTSETAQERSVCFLESGSSEGISEIASADGNEAHEKTGFAEFSEKSESDKTESFEKDKEQNWKKRTAGFLSGQALSLFGSMLVQYAMVFYLTLTYKSGVIMMVSMLCGFLPQIIISLFSGVLADRISRKALIIFSDGIIAASTLFLAIVFINGYKELWLLFTVMAIRSLGSGVQSPAVNAFIPQIAPQEKIMKINGINGAIQSIVMLVSPVLAAAVLALSSLEVIFFIDVITAAMAIAILYVLRVPKNKRDDKKTSYFNDLKNGLKYILREKPLRTFLLFWTAFMFLLTPAIFLPSIHIARAFGSEEWRLALNEVLFALGALISGVALSTWGGFKSRLKTLIIGCIIFSLFTLFMGFGRNTFTFLFGKPVFGDNFLFAVFVGCMFFSGIGMPLVNVPGMTLIQEYVEPAMHGRVFGLLQIVSSSAIPVGTLICGPLADIINIETMFIVSGLLLLIVCFLMIINKTVRQFECKRT